jgi:LPXTG-motif cell wall-anchored protein
MRSVGISELVIIAIIGLLPLAIGGTILFLVLRKKDG